ncbi:hypothetical protein, partial [Candidatus Amarolinea dominans]|uniref:hypothetical protein n=1 Tax=Candidatus Amarolinea dominans TaxID=3140696 RepID=UPI0031CC9A38
SGSAGGAAAQHSVQPTGEDLGRLTVLAAPAADGWRWAALPETGDWRPVGVGRSFDGRSRAGGWNGRGRWFAQARPVRLCWGGRCPTFRAADRGGSGPVDDVGGPGG